MTDLSGTIEPKSDQLNADSLIGKTLTIKVTRVTACPEPDQPIAVYFEGDGGKPYKPGKSMRRVLVNTWGKDGNGYVGRSMTLFRDPTVIYGGAEVGGIRISHMSHIEKPVTLSLSQNKKVRKPWTVQPLRNGDVTPPPKAPPLLVQAEEQAVLGTAAYEAFWLGLTKEQRSRLAPAHQGLKDLAHQRDEAGDGIIPGDEFPGDRFSESPA